MDKRTRELRLTKSHTDFSLSTNSNRSGIGGSDIDTDDDQSDISSQMPNQQSSLSVQSTAIGDFAMREISLIDSKNSSTSRDDASSHSSFDEKLNTVKSSGSDNVLEHSSHRNSHLHHHHHHHHHHHRMLLSRSHSGHSSTTKTGNKSSDNSSKNSDNSNSNNNTDNGSITSSHHRHHPLSFLSKLGKHKAESTKNSPTSTPSLPPTHNLASLSMPLSMTSLSSSVSSVASRSEIPESRASTEEAQSGASSFSRSSTAFPPGYVPEIALTTPFSYSSVKAPYITPQMRQHAEQLRRQALEADDTKKPKIDERGGGATPSASMSRTNSSVKFLNFTRKAARIAGDIAFGTSVYTNSYADERKIETLKARRQEKLAEDRSQQVEELRKKLVEAGKEKYLDNLRFFLKYMDDSEFNDPLAYAITRRDMWLLWYRKYLLKLKERIALYELLMSERSLLLSKKASPKQSPRQPSSLPPLPSVAIVRKGMFQDRRVLLSLLWYLQIFKKLVHQPAILKGIFKNMANVADAEEDPSSVQTTPEVCILTTNKLGTSGEAVAMAAPYLPENSIAAANIEFIDGWHLRHETEHTHVNVVTVADKLQTLTDIQGKGYLTPEVELENPQFNSAPLDKDFYQYQLGEREKEFMRNYSSFTTTGVSQIPLRDSSQSCIVAEDLTSCVDDPDSLAETLEEFARVLKPDGSIYLQLWDIDPCSQVAQQQAESRIRNSYEFVRYRMWQKISAYSEKRSLALPDITRRIVPALRRAGFKHVRTTFVGYPLLSTASVELDTSITESLDDNPAATEADGEIDANSFTEPVAPDSAPVIGSVSQERIESQSSASTIRSSVKGSKDARINSFFEVLSSFTEFLTAVKALRLHELSSDLAICENIAGLRKKAEEGIDTEAEIDTLLRSMKEVNREQLNMVKLFVDYKLNGVEAPLVKTEILQGTRYGERAYLCSHEETIDGESRYEGLGYMMVVVAERI